MHRFGRCVAETTRGPGSTELGPNWNNVCPERPKSALKSASPEIGSTSAKLCPKSAKCGPRLTNFDQTWSETGHIWPELEQSWPEFGQTWATPRGGIMFALKVSLSKHAVMSRLKELRRRHSLVRALPLRALTL